MHLENRLNNETSNMQKDLVHFYNDNFSYARQKISLDLNYIPLSEGTKSDDPPLFALTEPTVQ